MRTLKTSFWSVSSFQSSRSPLVSWFYKVQFRTRTSFSVNSIVNRQLIALNTILTCNIVCLEQCWSKLKTFHNWQDLVTCNPLYFSQQSATAPSAGWPQHGPETPNKTIWFKRAKHLFGVQRRNGGGGQLHTHDAHANSRRKNRRKGEGRIYNISANRNALLQQFSLAVSEPFWLNGRTQLPADVGEFSGNTLHLTTFATHFGSTTTLDACFLLGRPRFERERTPQC